MGKKKHVSGGNVTEAARTLGARGGAKGGPARAKSLTSAQRKQIAAKGGKAAARKKKG